MAARWGSFLQQAVAGVESRLDNILGETEEVPQQAKADGHSPAPQRTATTQPENAIPQRSTSNSPANDRLQERLARAIAAKNVSSSTNVPSRVGSPAVIPTSPRPSLDAVSVGGESFKEESNGVKHGDTFLPKAIGDEVSLTLQNVVESQTEESSTATSHENGLAITTAAAGLDMKRGNVDTPRQIAEPLDSTGNSQQDISGPDIALGRVATPSSHKEDILAGRQSISEENASDQLRQEEIHGYIERIDALQAKLQYLSKESASSARKAASAAPPGTLEKKLAEKDEQIALLLEEGQKLSKTELKHMTVIKKLRSKAMEVEKQSVEDRKCIERLEKENLLLMERLRHADVIERQSTERQQLLIQLQKEIEVTRAERDAKGSTISDLKAKLTDAVSQAKVQESKAAHDLLQKGKLRIMELENDLSAMKIEKDLAVERAEAQINELRAKTERQAERSRAMELEMRAEQQMLEGRLEILRTRAEEVSSGATGDAQAKLLRQIETLQSQYAVASENWQRIEASLTARVTTLEIERDDALRRESEIRKRAREVTQKAKINEEALKDTQSKTSSFERELTGQKEQLDKLLRRAEVAEAALLEAKKAFNHDKQLWAAEIQQRVEEERTKMRDEPTGSDVFAQPYGDSPVPSIQRSLTTEYLGLQDLQTRRGSARSVTPESPGIEKLLSRRSSTQPTRPGSGRGTPATPIRQDLMQSSLEDAHDIQISQASDNEDYFEHVVTPYSPEVKTNDMISVSTIGAGPSVQLMERLSAAVRRLESERVSAKEELTRLAGQRDEARAEIVTLMLEIESKRSLDSRMKALEDENVVINARYQTTLEMLGEKSELVEELKADVQDVKAMYRELVERTVN